MRNQLVLGVKKILWPGSDRLSNTNCWPIPGIACVCPNFQILELDLELKLLDVSLDLILHPQHTGGYMRQED